MPRSFLSSVPVEKSLFGRKTSANESGLANHSFRLILYLEWILLGVAFLLVIRPTRFGIHPSAQMLVTLILIGFGLMGLKLPTGRMANKVFYTIAELGLFLVTFWLDRRTGFFLRINIICGDATSTPQTGNSE